MRWIVRVVVVASLAACVWLLGQDDGPAPAGFQSFAKYQGEEEAIRKAEKLGVGEVKVVSGVDERAVLEAANTALRELAGK